MHLSAHCFNIKSICFKCGDRFNGDYKETDEARARRYRSGGGCLHFRCARCAETTRSEERQPPADQPDEAPMTIAEAKRRLAQSLGVDPEKIKILIEA